MDQLTPIKSLLTERGIAFGEHFTDEFTTVTVKGEAFGRMSKKDKLTLTDLAAGSQVSGELGDVVGDDPEFIHITHKKQSV